MTGSLNLGAFNITNVADPFNNQDAATKKYVDDNTLLSRASYIPF